MRKQPRKGNGRYKQSSWYNFRKKKRGWREYAISPITVSVFGCLVWLGANTAWAMNELERLDGKIDIYNFSTDFTKFESESIREDSQGDERSSSTEPTPGLPEESTGETVSAVSERTPRESVEGSTPAMEQSPSTVEAKILKAWEGTKDGRIAVAVAKGESKLRSDAVGDKHIEFWHEGKKMGHSCGIFQIRVLPGRPDCETLKNADKNIEYARKLYDRAGFQPWTVFTKGTYIKYL